MAKSKPLSHKLLAEESPTIDLWKFLKFCWRKLVKTWNESSANLRKFKLSICT